MEKPGQRVPGESQGAAVRAGCGWPAPSDWPPSTEGFPTVGWFIYGPWRRRPPNAVIIFFYGAFHLNGGIPKNGRFRVENPGGWWLGGPLWLRSKPPFNTLEWVKKASLPSMETDRFSVRSSMMSYLISLIRDQSIPLNYHEIPLNPLEITMKFSP